MNTPDTRRPGDPIPPTLIRELRMKSGLTQDQLADRLGVRGGKAVISGWETGRAACEGPAAELVLLLLGHGNTNVDLENLNSEVEAMWNRAGNARPMWRQVSFVPGLPVGVDTDRFVRLFPSAALQKVKHGFPFHGQDLGGNVCRVGPSGWIGSIPDDKTRTPFYLWILKQDGRFSYREHAWEEDPQARSGGNFDTGTTLMRVLEMTFFLRKLASRITFPNDSQITLRLDLEGASGRRFVDAQTYMFSHRDLHPWNENHIRGQVTTSIQEAVGDPLCLGSRLFVEVAAYAHPSLNTTQAVARYIEQLRQQKPESFEFMNET